MQKQSRRSLLRLAQKSKLSNLISMLKAPAAERQQGLFCTARDYHRGRCGWPKSLYGGHAGETIAHPFCCKIASFSFRFVCGEEGGRIEKSGKRHKTQSEKEGFCCVYGIPPGCSGGTFIYLFDGVNGVFTYSCIFLPGGDSSFCGYKSRPK